MFAILLKTRTRKYISDSYLIIYKSSRSQCDKNPLGVTSKKQLHTQQLIKVNISSSQPATLGILLSKMLMSGIALGYYFPRC